MTEFIEMEKIPRWNRRVIVTEKIDGTNAGILIQEDGTIQACSKNRVLTLDLPDNYGFRAWVDKNKEELLALGPGLHRGEWWGAGIQRRYGMAEKRFSLFNVSRWRDDYCKEVEPLASSALCPACCRVVPVLSIEEKPENPRLYIDRLISHGSYAAPGFMDPEGIVIYHEAAGSYFKATIKGDEQPKSFMKGGAK